MNVAEVINECVSACRKMLLLPHLKVKTVLSCHDKSVIGKPSKGLCTPAPFEPNTFEQLFDCRAPTESASRLYRRVWSLSTEKCGVLDEPTVLTSSKTFA